MKQSGSPGHAMMANPGHLVAYPLRTLESLNPSSLETSTYIIGKVFLISITAQTIGMHWQLISANLRPLRTLHVLVWE